MPKNCLIVVEEGKELDLEFLEQASFYLSKEDKHPQISTIFFDYSENEVLNSKNQGLLEYAIGKVADIYYGERVINVEDEEIEFLLNNSKYNPEKVYEERIKKSLNVLKNLYNFELNDLENLKIINESVMNKVSSELIELYRYSINYGIKRNIVFECSCDPEEFNLKVKEKSLENKGYRCKCSFEGCNLDEKIISNFLYRLRPESMQEYSFYDFVLGTVRFEGLNIPNTYLADSGKLPSKDKRFVVENFPRHDLIITSAKNLLKTKEQVMIANRFGVKVPKFLHI